MPNQVLSDNDKRAFIRDGYIVLRGAIPSYSVGEALSLIDAAYVNGEYEFDDSKFDPVPVFSDTLKNNPVLGELLDRANVIPAMEELLGEGNVQFNRAPQVAFRTKDQRMLKRSMGMSDMIQPFKYHIDGGTGTQGKTGTPFTMLVGVCLSEGQDVDENRGQFTAWPGSHFKLHHIVRQRYNAGLIEPNQILGGQGPTKPKIGSPVRVLMNPGDVVLAHQRLGHAGGLNLCEHPRKNLYFRIRRKKHHINKYDMINGSVFHEYDGVHHLTEDIAQAEKDALAAEEKD